jgi:hypothetical protein
LAPWIFALAWGCSAEDAKDPETPEPPPSGPVTAAGVRWVGRVDASDTAVPAFTWSGTGFVASVSGSSIAVKLGTKGSSDAVFFQPVIDGVPGQRFSVSTPEQIVSLGTGLAGGEHVVELYRESEGKFADSQFRGFSEGTLGTPPAAPGRLLEIVGDSISAGFGNLGSEEHPNYGPDPDGGCEFSTETQSAYLTYGAMAARQVGADASIVALSGWGAYRDNTNSKFGTLSKVYENTLGVRSMPLWTFGQQADAVVINLGTNDFSAGDPGQAEFEGAYTALLRTIRAKYPDAFIFCMIGPLLYGSGLSSATSYITAVVAAENAAGDARVKLLNFGQQNSSLGTGCSYHPNVTVHTQMAGQLVAELRAALGW